MSSLAGNNGSGVAPDAWVVNQYATRETWSPVEGVYLAYAIYPAVMTGGRGGGAIRPPPLTNEQVQFVALAEQAIEEGDLDAMPSPQHFLAWADAVGLRFHDKWLEPLGLGRIDGRLLPADEARRIQEARREAFLIEQWAMAPSWTIQEGLALSMNFLPQFFENHEVRQLPNSIRPEFERRQLFAERARKRHELNYMPTPRQFLDWAAALKFPFSEAWEAAVPGKELRAPMKPTEPADRTLGTRERETLLKLLIGMAIQGYAYDPSANRNSAISDIANDMAELGVRVHVDTVRKWLNEAKDLIPRENTDDFA